jgi:cysteine-rich repeat protein
LVLIGSPDAAGRVDIDVTLRTGGFSVGGLQNDIIFDNTQVSLAVGDCRINPAISSTQASCKEDPVVGPCKNLSKTLKQCGTSPQPPGCPTTAGSNLSVFRGIVAASAVPNTNSIPDGSVLYTCTFSVVGALPATLTNSNVVASEPDGTRLTDVTGSNGAITSTCGDGIVDPGSEECDDGNSVSDDGCESNCTLSPPETPTATRTATPTRTATRTATATHTRTPTRTPTPCTGACDGGTAVTVDGLLTMVTIALGNRSVSACQAGDTDRDGRITIDEVLRAVSNALYGCGVVPPTPLPTRTRTQTATLTTTATHTFTATPTRTATPPVVHIDVGAVTGMPGRVVVVAVSIRSSGMITVATGNDISYRHDLFDLDVNDCVIDPSIGKTLLVSALPSDPDSRVTSIRAFVQSVQNTDPIPDGPLYSCRLTIKPSTLPGSYTLTNSPTIAFGPDGSQHKYVTGDNGSIRVSLVGPGD